MRRLFPTLMFCLVVVLVASCGRDESPTAPPVNFDATLDAEQIAGEIIDVSGWELAPDSELALDKRGHLLDFSREVISGDIVHYWWDLPAGDGEYDRVRLHRVVREERELRPIRSRNSVFMLHGDFKDFVGCFLPGMYSGAYPDDFGIAVYLARHDVDVWGIDQTYNAVPADVTDLAFMADWGMMKQVDDTVTGLTVARYVRLHTRNGLRKMHLLGYSGGAALGFAVVDAETALPPGRRQVGGFIPVDQGTDYADLDFAAEDCAASGYYADQIAAGEYAEPSAFPLFGEPALVNPDGPSALIDGMTNLQAALAIAVYPYIEGFPYHFLAGTFDADGLPDGLQYTNVDLWVDFLVNAPAYFPNAYSRDEFAPACGWESVPWVQNLDVVDLPILFVAAGGGFGQVYTLDRMAAADMQMLTVSLHPPEEIALDFAHIDLFTADNAQSLVWQPILAWTEAHRN